ncbi:uncharacterized protein LOC114799125 [Denticeps clupeoides]|uniref:uncharacterized protein LOC114799125 n=1 Tax=Denticeps clupeoides TaxID=299321 RepID=UPI0010A51064|nr:uncharacterized protein LOC114799125 [Denticeps clupeoides]
MPLFRLNPKTAKSKGKDRVKRSERGDASLSRLCLLSLAENMEALWVKDYAQNYMDQYFFRYVMGPFSLLSTELLEELLALLSSRHLLTRAALHLLLAPQLRCLSLARCPILVTPNLCAIVAARCQILHSLDLSNAVHITSSVLCELLASLPKLLSLTLAGSISDDRVLQNLSRQCPALRHLDVSRCHNVTPLGLLQISPKSPHSAGLQALRSLHAQDIGFGDMEGDRKACAAFLLLSMTGLERVALEELGKACKLILERDFHEVEQFCAQAGVPSLREVWDERVQQDHEKKGETSVTCLPAEAKPSLHMEGSDDDDSSEDEGAEGVRLNFGPRTECMGTKRGLVTLHLKEVQVVSFGTLFTIGNLCPDLRSLSLQYCEEEGMLYKERLARELGSWSGRLKSLRMRFPGPLSELVLAVECVGASLKSLTLEGVQASGLTSLLQVLQSCPQLTTLAFYMEPPPIYGELDDDEDVGELEALPCLPQLTSLTLNFCDEQERIPSMSWPSLKGALWALLSGSPLLEKVSLVAVPCPMDPVFGLVFSDHGKPLRASEEKPLQHLTSLRLAHCKVSMLSLLPLLQAARLLCDLDLTGCWHVFNSHIKKLQAARRRHKLHITWT